MVTEVLPRSWPAAPVERACWLGREPPIHSREAFEAYQRDGHDPRVVERHLAARQRRGGSLATLHSDFRDFTPDRPFDIVLVPLVWSCLVDDDRPELARRAFTWLAPGGMCFLVTLGIREPYTTALLHHFT